MSLPSKFPDHDCKKCGITIKKGDAVNKVPAGNWCSNPKCPQPIQKAADAAIVESTAPAAPEDLPISATLRNFVRDESHKLQTIEAMVLETVPEETRKNGQKVGMYVKEIYRRYNSTHGGHQN